MAANSRHGTGLRIAGFVFATTGLIFMITGDTAIGITAIAMGVVFIAVGGPLHARHHRPIKNNFPHTNLPVRQMPPIISNDPGWVWFALLLFYAFGLVILAKGLEAGSPGATTIGSMLLLGGIYYSVQWCLFLET